MSQQQTPIFELVVTYESSKQAGLNTCYNEDSYNRLIDYFEYEFLYREALEVTEEALVVFPFTIEFLYRKIHLHIFAGNPDAALAALEKAESLIPETLDSKLHRAWIYAEKELFDECFSILEHLKETLSDPIELSLVYYYEAMVYEHMGNIREAFDILKKAIKLDPSNEEALEKIWWCMNRLSTHKETIPFFREVVDLEPYSWWAWFNLASALEYDCRYEEAVEAYEFAIVTDENREQAYRNCIEIYFLRKEYDRALKLFEDLLRRFRADSDLYLKIGICKLKTGKIAAAKKFLGMAQLEDEFNEEVYYYLGECYRKQGKAKQAILFYKKAISLSPIREEFFQGLGNAYYQLDKIKEANAYFRRATDVGPDILNNWRIYFEFLYNINEVSKALDILEEAAVFHDSALLKYYKIAYNIALGKKSEAFYYLEEALEEDFSSHTVLFDAHPEILQNREVIDYINDFKQRQLSDY